MSEMAPEYRLAAMTDAELTEAAQGCTELTCPYHGTINQARHERGIRR